MDNTSDASKNTAVATLTNKTLTAPIINNPTGIVKGDVGLGSVDNTSDAAKNSAAVTLTNKTLTAPTVNSPTGIVKGDVGLGNVDDTSDTTKNSAVATLSNKTLTSPVLNGTISGNAFLDEDNMVSDSAIKVASQQSIKAYVDAAGGGGQVLYDVIIDAAGDGDYASIKTAIDSEPSGTTMFIRNGAYSETLFINIKPGQKLVGESRNGVVLTSSSTSWSVFRASFGAYRGGSERNANNTAWTTNSIGTVSAVNGSAVLTYNGTTVDPVAGDLIHVEPNVHALIDSVDTGLKQITLDRTWGGPTASGLDCIVVDTILTDTETRTEYSNMTIIANVVGHFRNFDSLYNFHMSNVKLVQTGSTSNNFMFSLTSNMRCSYDDIEMDGGDVANTKGFLVGWTSDVHVRNLIVYNMPNHATQLGGGSKAMRRSTFHFKSLSCSGQAMGSPTGIYRTLIQIDNILAPNIAIVTGGSAAKFFECKIEVKRAVLTLATTVFEAAKSIFVFNYVDNNVEVKNISDATNNLITDSYIDGTLTVDSEAVISGSVMYDALSGVPAQNNGFLF